MAGIRNSRGMREGVFFKWGLVPSWARDEKIGYNLINARAETVHEKPSFSRLLRDKRCIIPANGFYEWEKKGRFKKPFIFRLKKGEIFGFAGLWDQWTLPGGSKRLETCAIITTQANRVVRKVHSRMPVIIPLEDIEKWLSLEQDMDDLLDCLKPFPPEMMEMWPVSTLVNKPGFDSPRCIEPYEGGDA